MNELINADVSNEDKKHVWRQSNETDMSPDILQQTGLYIQQFFEQVEGNGNTFYNYPSSLKAVKAVEAIGLDAGLNKRERLIVKLAAWFLQTGYKLDPAHPTERSAETAENHLSGRLENDLVLAIKECILATRFPQNPITLTSKVICDAATIQLAEKNFTGYLEALPKEIKVPGQMGHPEKDWLRKQLELPVGNIFYTDSANKIFDKRKQKNRKKMKKMLKQLQNQTEVTQVLKNDAGEKQQSNVILEDKVKLERGVESLFRITSRRHIELATLAHNKASLLISINALIISVVLSVLSTKLQDNRQLVLPTVLLILTNVSAMVIAFISTRPIILGNKKKADFHQANESNILFFGHFLKLSLSEFKLAIRKTIKDKDLIYDSLSRDIYYQGLVLTGKYRFITISYYVFIVGLILSTLAFILTFIFYKP